MRSLELDVQKLMTIQANHSPVVSCYFNPSSPNRLFSRETLARLWRRVSRMDRRRRKQFKQALSKIRHYFSKPSGRIDRAKAVFCRSGDQPFFIAIDIPGRHFWPWGLSVGPYPHVEPLVVEALNIRRVVALLSSDIQTQILEYSVSDLVKRYQDLGPQVDPGNPVKPSKIHYLAGIRGDLITHAKGVLRRLGGLLRRRSRNTAVALSGRTRLARWLKAHLPWVAQRRLLLEPDGVYKGKGLLGWLRYLVTQALIAQREMVYEPGYKGWEQVRREGLALEGAANCLSALKQAQVDRLFIRDDFSPARGWACFDCGQLRVETLAGPCAHCGCEEHQSVDIKKEILEAARASGVEIVRTEIPLEDGVACLKKAREKASNRMRWNDHMKSFGSPRLYHRNAA